MEEKKKDELTEQILPTEEIREQEPAPAPEEAVEEKDTTTELREQYEEAVAEGKEEGMKKRKKFTKKKIVLMSVGGFILLVIIAVGLFFLISTLLWKEPPKSKYVDFKNPPPDVETTYSAAQTTMITESLALAASNTELAEADKDKIKATIAEMYQKANYNKIHCDQALAALRGEGHAALTVEALGQTFEPSGGMIVRGIKVQSGKEFYYQKVAMVNDCSVKVPLVLSIVKKKLNQQERAYTNGVDDFRLTGTLKDPDMKISDENEYETVPFLKGDLPKKITYYDSYEGANGFRKNGYYLEDPREITNFKIIKDYIVLGELMEGQQYIEYDEEKGYYTLRFSLAYDNDDCVQVARQYLRDSAQKDVPANEQDLQYGKFDIVMEVWENGYLKMMHDDEEWHGTVDGTETTSTSWYESVMFYGYAASLFEEEDQARYEGDDWAKKVIANYKEELDQIKK